MKKILTARLILVAILFISISCAKKKDDPSVISDCKVVSFTNPFGGENIVTYTGDGKIQTILYPYQGGKSSYTHIGNTVIELKTDNADKVTDSTVYTVNSDGNVIKGVSTRNYYQNGVLLFGVSDTYLYEYDDNGYLIKETNITGGYTYVSTYSYRAGNLISCQDGAALYEYEYYTGTVNNGKHEYYISKENNGIRNVGLRFGRDNNNLLKKEVFSIADIKNTSYYVYELDSKNNVTKMVRNTIASNSFSSVSTFDYVYECK